MMAIVRRERCLGVLVAWRRLAGKALALGAVELDIETEFADLELVQAHQHLLGVLFAAEGSETVSQVDALVVGLEWQLNVDWNGEHLDTNDN